MTELYWAELHNHNSIGYGKGSLDRSYTLARNTLDIYAFTPHGYWPDVPDADPKLVYYHSRAFDRVADEFSQVVDKANAEYRPGEFVSLIGYEWHSIKWGDYVALFPGEAGAVYHARDLDDLHAFARREKALLIPHHVAYRHGWQGLDWQAIDPELTPLVEVFSEHGNSMEADGAFPMLNRSICPSKNSSGEQPPWSRHSTVL